MLFINTTARIINEPHIAADYHGATSQAYRLGVVTAQLEEICIPEVYFRNPQDKRDFCAGYASVKGATLTTTQFLGGKH